MNADGGGTLKPPGFCSEKEPHEAVLREAGDMAWFANFASETLSMLANLCLAEDWKELFTWFSLTSVGIDGCVCVCVLSASTADGDGEAAGTKNFGFGVGVVACLMDGGGDWNKLVGLPAPWLKVSTYLARTPVLPRAEN